jgi:peroxiredoxin
MRYSLVAAGVCSLAWAAGALVWPLAMYRWAGVEGHVAPEWGQFAGVLGAMLGMAYLAASTNPLRHWPVVLAGLIGKIAIPFGYWHAAAQGRLSWNLAAPVFADGVIWWVPFGLILYSAWETHIGKQRQASPEVQKLALRARTQHGETLLELSRKQPLLLIFLRHTGCTFCREALSDLASQRRHIEATGTGVAVVHMSEPQRANIVFRQYGIEDIHRVSDRSQSIYKAFGLTRGKAGALVGPKVWWRGFVAAFVKGHGLGKPDGDAFQMPGVFLIFHGEVIRSYRHHTAADRPDYQELAGLPPAAGLGWS